MVANRPYIIYSLPQSRMTQNLKGGKIEKAWVNIERFLIACTNADIENPKSIYLQGYSADEDNGEHPELPDKLISQTKELFGDGVTNTIGYLFPSNEPLQQRKTEWKLTPKEFDKALKFIISGQPYPKYNLGPIELVFSYDFKLIDLDSKLELPNQQFTSSLLIWFSKTSCVAPSLCFPYIESNKEFWDYVNSIEKHVPFKFDKKWLRLGRSNKKGTSNVFSKL